MKRIPVIIVLMLLNLVSYAQVPMPGKPAFMVTYEESGKNGNESWNYKATIKFSLSNWNEPLRGKGTTAEERKLPLDFDPAKILTLQPGAKITFYRSEIDEWGSSSSYRYTRVLYPDGVETVTETDSRGTHRTVITDEDYRRENNIPSNENFWQNARYYQTADLATLERTATGAILEVLPAVGNNVTDWAVTDETRNQVFPEVLTFVLTDQDLRLWQQISRTNTASGSFEDFNEKITVRLSVKMEIPDIKKPIVTLNGCTQFGSGEHGKAIASGKPDGGTYEFRVEPSDLMSVEAEGASATLSGSRLGRGTIYVKYTAPDGSVGETSQPASVVALYSYNNNNPLPQIAFFDVEGKKKTASITVPYSADPENSNELLDFVQGDATLINLIPSSGSIEIKGLKTGKTTLEAKDNCGNIVGPTVEVEVVNCDRETVEALKKMREGAVENIQDAAQRLQKIAGSKEFEKARDNLVLSTLELLGKAGMTIVTSGGTPSTAVNTVSTVAEATAAVLDMISSGSLEEFYTNAGKAASGELFDKAVYTHFGKKIGEEWGKSLGSIIGVIEVYEAAKRFGDDAGQVLKHEQELDNAMEIWKKADNDFKRIEKLHRICMGDKTEPKKPEEPKADQTPEPTKPTPPTEPKPKTETPPAREVPTEEPVTPEPGDEEPPVPPTTPTGETRQVGLPYSPEECGCEESKSISLGSAGFSTLQAGIKNLSDCVERYSVSVNDYSKALVEISAVRDTLNAALADNPATFRMKATEAKPRLDSLLERTKAYGEAGQIFLKQFEKCPESVKSGMDVLESALTVTIDSVKTKY